MPRLLPLLVLVAALSGCFSKGPSQAEMEAQAAEAIAAFRADVGEAGRLASIAVSGHISFETQYGGFTVKPTLNPDVDVTLGPHGAVLVDGQLADMRFTGYCDPARIVAITHGTDRYGMQDVSIESRNPIGRCTGEGSEALLTPFFEFELIDPAILTGALYVEDLDARSFSKAGKGIEAEYTAEGPAGTTTLFFKIRGDRVMQIVADNPDSKLVMDMTYGERATPQAPEADRRLPSPVSGAQRTDEDGWHWSGHSREGGPLEEYRLAVHSAGTNVSCTGASSDPVVEFDLGAGADQRHDGWHLLLLDDGDGVLGDGDEIYLRQPSSAVQDFDHEVRFVDDWAGSTAGVICAIPPAPLGLVGLGIVALLWFVRRR